MRETIGDDKRMIKDVFCFKIGGPAGFGIMSAGLTFSKICTRSGYEIYDYTEYPSIIRGGHNVMQVSVSKSPVYAPVKHTDFLVALNKETVDLHKDELVPGSVVLYNSAQEVDEKNLPTEVKACGMPFVQIAKDLGGAEVMRNTVAMGATMALLGGELDLLMNLIAEEFGDKKPEIVDINQKVARAGYDFALEKFNDVVRLILRPLFNRHSELVSESGRMTSSASKSQFQGGPETSSGRQNIRMVVTADEAVAMGAIAAGMQFAAIYPMTPISNILHTLAPLQEKYGFVYKQPEDEISGINMALGVAYAGARSMVATAGGGFCLMTEGYGLAGMTETPLVIIEGMRGSPATGLPTWTEQGDLRFILHAHQGDFLRIVLAAGDAEEAFNLTMQAFNLADKYQTPVVVMVDKMICESHQSFAPFNYNDDEIDRGKIIMEKIENYQRYAMADDGISARSFPGLGNYVMANSDEHNQEGYSDEEAENRKRMMDKRMKKLEICAAQDMGKPILYGPEEAEITIVSWGSNKGAILQAMKVMNGVSGSQRDPSLRNSGVQDDKQGLVNYIHNVWMNPFPDEAVFERLSKSKKIINIECNYSGQLRGWIRQMTGIYIKDSLLKYDGRPIYPEEIVTKVKSVL